LAFVARWAGQHPGTDVSACILHGCKFETPVCIIPVQADVESLAFWKEHNPHVLSMAQAHFDKHPPSPTAFICQNFTCQAPTQDPKEVIKQLQQGTMPGRPPIQTTVMPGM
jgi:uncharacterized protein YyaL (SSP411 family)